MIKTGMIQFSLLMTTALLLGQNCSQIGSDFEEPKSTAQSQSRNSCAAPAGISASPKSIEEAVELINSLPKPTTLACFLQSLARPLQLSLTNNRISGQPANGDRSPRVFIFYGDLIISIVPDGPGADVVEFSLRTAPSKTIKAELPFPVQKTLSPGDPYEGIRREGGTHCGLCHGGEERAPQIKFADAYVSNAFKPSFDTIVGLDSFRAEALHCDPERELSRCKVLDSIFRFGEVRSQNFPADFMRFF